MPSLAQKRAASANDTAATGPCEFAKVLSFARNNKL
jgi:hypothetical protein